MMLQKGAGAIIGYSDLLLYSSIILFSKKFLKNFPQKNFPRKKLL